MSRPERLGRLRPLTAVSALAIIAVLLIVFWGGPSGRPTLNDRVRTVAIQLRCPVCQGESVWDSPSGLAGEMRTVIRTQLRHGRSEAQVKAYFVSRYRQWIILEPPSTGVGILAWVLPPIGVLAGLVVLAFLSRAWLRNRRRDVSVDLSSAADASWALERLEDQLDDGAIDESDYLEQRSRLEPRALSAPPLSSSYSRRRWLQAGIMVTAAVVIAASISLAVQQRGSAAITGTVPGGSSSTPTPTTALPKQVSLAFKVVGRHPRAGWAWTRLGSTLLRRDQTSGAQLAFQKAVKVAPFYQPARLELAFVDIGLPRESSASQAIEVLIPIVKTHPDSARLWLLEALARERLSGQTKQVTADFRRYLKLAPNGPLHMVAQEWIDKYGGTG